MATFDPWDLDYVTALNEAVALIGSKPERCSGADERLDLLLKRIRAHPPAYDLRDEAGGETSPAQLAQLRAMVEAFVRRRADAEAYNAFPHREHGVGPTTGQ